MGERSHRAVVDEVVTARERLIDLSNSVLATGEYREQFMAQPEGKQPIVKVNGCGLVDEDERLQPLVSTYLSLNLRKKSLAFASVKSYASRLCLLLQDLKTNVEFEGCYRDEAFLSVTIGRLETYLANLAANGLAPKTIQTRDAAHQERRSRLSAPESFKSRRDRIIPSFSDD